MYLPVSELIEVTRSYIDEPSADASDWSDAELMLYLNFEHKHLFSRIRSVYEDWFLKRDTFDLVSGTYQYWLPHDCVNYRRLELISASSVSGTYPFYVIDESTSNPQRVDEIGLQNKATIRNYSANTKLFGTGCNFLDDQVEFEPNQDIGSSYKARLFYLPSAPNLHQATATAGSSSTITFPSSATYGSVSILDNYYTNMRIYIVSGTGAGQLKRISKYVGSTRVATVDSDWTTNPDNTSVYSIISPIKSDWHEMLALGAVFRAKGIKVEDDVSGAGVIYQALEADMVANLKQRNHQTGRSVVRRR